MNEFNYFTVIHSIIIKHFDFFNSLYSCQTSVRERENCSVLIKDTQILNSLFVSFLFVACGSSFRFIRIRFRLLY